MITAKTVECKHISFDCIIVPKYYSISRKKNKNFQKNRIPEESLLHFQSI